MESANTIIAPRAGVMLRSDHHEDVVLDDVITVGRERDCSLRIQDKRISRHHARITVVGTRVVVEDLRSTNGTFVNGKRIEQSEPIWPGDELRFNNLTFRVVSDPAFDPEATLYGGEFPGQTAILPEAEVECSIAARVPEVKTPSLPIASVTREKLTAIQRQLKLQHDQDEAFLHHVADLALGVWIEFSDTTGNASVCCMLAAGGDGNQRCYLVPCSGFGIIEKSSRDIGIDMQRGRARVLEKGPLRGRLAVFLTSPLRSARWESAA